MARPRPDASPLRSCQVGNSRKRRYAHPRLSRPSAFPALRWRAVKVSYIVSLSVPVATFRDRLAAVEGAVFVRELPPERVVVVLPAGKVALRRLEGIAGVDAVVAERIEHLHTDR